MFKINHFYLIGTHLRIHYQKNEVFDAACRYRKTLSGFICLFFFSPTLTLPKGREFIIFSPSPWGGLGRGLLRFFIFFFESYHSALAQGISRMRNTPLNPLLGRGQFLIFRCRTPRRCRTSCLNKHYFGCYPLSCLFHL